MTRAASLAALVRERLATEDVRITPGKRGQFDVFVDGEPIAARGGNALTRPLFGAGFPDLEGVVRELERRQTVAF